MIDARWALVLLNTLAALAVLTRLTAAGPRKEMNRGINGFLLGVNSMAVVWVTYNIVAG